MIRGTNAGFKFTLPYPLGKLASAKVTFWQDGYTGTTHQTLPIKKEFTNFSESDESTQLTVTLSADDTKLFTDKLKARVQLVARTREVRDAETGTVIEPSVRFASRISLITVHPMSDDIIEDRPEDIAPVVDNYVVLDGQWIV